MKITRRQLRKLIIEVIDIKSPEFKDPNSNTMWPVDTLAILGDITKAVQGTSGSSEAPKWYEEILNSLDTLYNNDLKIKSYLESQPGDSRPFTAGTGTGTGMPLDKE